MSKHPRAKKPTTAGRRRHGKTADPVKRRTGRARNRGDRTGKRAAPPPEYTGADRIIALLYKTPGGVGRKEIHQALGAESRRRRREIDHTLSHLAKDRVLTLKSRSYTLKQDDDLLEAVFHANPRGFGFVTPTNLKTADSGKHDRSEDLFIPPPATGRAAHGDLVLVRKSRRPGARSEARVLTVLKRGTTRVVGIYRRRGEDGLVIPEDNRLNFSVEIAEQDRGGAEAGQAVLCEIIEFQAERHNPTGRVVKNFGDPSKAAVQAEIVIAVHELPDTFSPGALQEAGELSGIIKPDRNRVDLREVPHITIDGDTARDFDDAVAIEERGEHFRLYVSIADVSHYIRPGSLLDREACQRGTSVYFPGRVVPMLPERLSNDLCSLVPDQDRYALSAILDFDRRGRLMGKKFKRSIIRSHHRFTYSTVAAILADKDQRLRQEHAPFLTALSRMRELAASLERARMKRGSIAFEVPQAEIKLADDGSIEQINRSRRNLAHKLIEEFMLAANEAVALTFSEQGGSRHGFLYRIHEAPDPLKVKEFAEFARGIGINTPPEPYNARWFNAVIKSVSNSPREYITGNLLLRTMQQARYSADNAGHFGLAAENYCHFTSPIRRYPDLMVHRALISLTGGAAPERSDRNPDADEAGVFLSQRERVAVESERDIVERLQAWYCSKKIGESFAGIISGVAAFGLFIELIDSMISGAVAMRDLRGDYYEIDDKNHRITGRGSGRTLQVGDLVKVKLTEVNLERRQINFTLVD